jgi:hypothetical protein
VILPSQNHRFQARNLHLIGPSVIITFFERG